jgi:hypothetical protein
MSDSSYKKLNMSLQPKLLFLILKVSRLAIVVAAFVTIGESRMAAYDPHRGQTTPCIFS